MAKFKVPMARTQMHYLTIEVEAHAEEEAEYAALEECSNYDFNDGTGGEAAYHITHEAIAAG